MGVTGGGSLAIGSLSRQTGSKVETIRYYERIGLLPTPARTASGYRRYDRAHLTRLAFIRRARALGFSLDEVRRDGQQLVPVVARHQRRGARTGPQVVGMIVTMGDEARPRRMEDYTPGMDS